MFLSMLSNTALCYTITQKKDEKRAKKEQPMLQTQYQNYIEGKWQSAQSGQTFPNYNPATGELLGHFPLSGETEANAAVAAARTAFEQWRLVPAPKRGEILFRAGE